MFINLSRVWGARWEKSDPNARIDIRQGFVIKEQTLENIRAEQNKRPNQNRQTLSDQTAPNDKDSPNST